MTRINTNVSSLVAQRTLTRSNSQLQESLTRLSTGLRINVGKDDPAGLIASEVLRSDIISVQRAITNSERANQLIATADSALGQVSSLLNDIRGLVSEAANTGALSEEQIAANQLQVDSSLEAIDRIAQTTSFQGRRLLDGSLDFLTTGTTGGTNALAAGTFGIDDVAATATIDPTGTHDAITFTAKTVGSAANGYSISYVHDGAVTAGSEVVSIDTVGKNLVFHVDTAATTATNIITALQNSTAAAAVFTAALVSGNNGTGLVDAAAGSTGTSGVDGTAILITAANAGPSYNNVDIAFTSGGTNAIAFDAGSQRLLITRSANTTAANIVSAINAEGTFTATLDSNGLGVFTAAATDFANVTTGGSLERSISDLKIEQANFGTANSIAVEVLVDAQATKGELTYSGGTLTADLVLEIGGAQGFEVFNFGSGSTVNQIASALNLVADATGVSAEVEGTNLVLSSNNYGSKEFVSARALSGTFNAVDGTATVATRDAGSDIAVRVNGVQATGDGLKASVNTSTLDLSFSVNDLLNVNSTFTFSITGGGANFQLGPDVVSNQQARVGIQGVSTATLGGVSGSLYELKSGGDKALNIDVKGAAAVVDEVITSVVQLRGRLGAFQRTTLETNIFTLNDTLTNLTEAESSIRDADFAAESARLTRAQILVQSGTAVLGIANSNPQNVLSLLRG